MSYLYHGNRLVVPRAAEVSPAFRNSEGVFGATIQKAVNEVESWDAGRNPRITFDLGRQIGSRVVALDETEVPLWAINPQHTARLPGLSPFILLGRSDGRAMTGVMTLEMAGTPRDPILTRVYPGEYMPPLPWMATAKNVEIGVDGCAEFWNGHAFVANDNNRPDGLTPVHPDWYTRTINVEQAQVVLPVVEG